MRCLTWRRWLVVNAIGVAVSCAACCSPHAVAQEVPAPDAVVAACQPRDDALAALKSLYAATGGPHWVNSSGWPASTSVAASGRRDAVPRAAAGESYAAGYGGDNDLRRGGVRMVTPQAGLYCQWQGVTCDAECFVTVLDLRSNGLSGNVPASAIAPHKRLTVLDLRDNRDLGGELPDAFEGLDALQQLLIARCGFTGAIPASVGMLGNLAALWASNNNFVALPGNMSGLVNLTSVDLRFNALRGALDVAVLALGSLRHLELSWNLDLTGRLPDGDVMSTSLEYIELDNTGITGTIPGRGLARLANLQRLHLSNCSLSGTLPVALSTLSELRHLHLDGCGLQLPEFPTWLARMPRIESIMLSSNDIEGTLPTDWSRAQRLSVLACGACGLVGPLPLSLVEAPSLQTLILSSNQLSGGFTMPRPGRATSNLAIIDVRYNEFSGPLENASSLTELKTLYAANNLIEGGVVRSGVSHLRNLSTVSLAVNRFSCALHHDDDGGESKLFPGVGVGAMNILDGNLWDCPIEQTVVQRDERGTSYLCGNTLFFFSCGAAMACILVLGGAKLLHSRYGFVQPSHSRGGKESSDSNMEVPLMPSDEDDGASAPEISRAGDDAPAAETAAELFARSLGRQALKEVLAYQTTLRLTMRFVFFVALCGIALMPFYAESTASYICRKAFTVSIAFSFLEHPDIWVPTAVICAMLLFGGLIWVWSLNRVRVEFWKSGRGSLRGKRYFTADSSARSDAPTVLMPQWGTTADATFSTEGQRMKSVLLSNALLASCLVLTAAPYGAFVVVEASRELGSVAKRAAVAGISLFKAVMLSLLLPRISSWYVRLQRVERRKHRFEVMLRMTTALSLVSSIVYPVLSVLLLDRRCFSSHLWPPPAQTVEIPLQQCNELSHVTGKCVEPVTVDYQVSVRPTILYSTSCPSAVIETYGPVFVLSVAITGFVSPAARLLTDIPAVRARLAAAYRRCVGRRAPPLGAARMALDLRTHFVEIVAITAAAVVFGPLYPPVAVASAISLAGKLVGERWLVAAARRRRLGGFGGDRPRVEAGDGDDGDAWTPQGARGLTMSVAVAPLVLSTVGLQAFLGFGMVVAAPMQWLGAVLAGVLAIGVAAVART